MKTFLLTVLCLLFINLGNAMAWTLMWDTSTGTVDGYLVEISIDDGATWAYLYGTDTPGLNLDNKCAYGQAYKFRVSAFNAAGVSAPCPPISWVRPPYTPPPDRPMPVVNIGPTGTPTNTNIVQ